MSRLLDYRKLLILVSQVFLFVAGYFASFLLRFDFRPDAAYRDVFALTLPVLVGIDLIVFYVFGLLRGWWRYVGMSDALDIGEASLVSTVCFYVLITFVLRIDEFPRSVFAINCLITILLVGGTRFAVRAYTESAQTRAAQLLTLIVGAGGAGSRIAHELVRNSNLNLKPVGFVDDDPSKYGIRISGLKVLGSCGQMSDLIHRLNIRCILIAIPSATGQQIEQIIGKCRQCKIDFKILPPLSSHLAAGQSSLADVRPPRLEDLLGREPIHIDLESIRKQLAGKVLLVTGAGGSIGSELIRQVIEFKPREIIAIDRSENSLFTVGMELQSTQAPYVPLVADIQDVAAMRDIFSRHRPDVVFHAAAYKHVPLMEQSCFQAVSNNIFGTYNIALVARQFGCSAFVMISSDKAVNPTSVMGVTKRIAELIILSLPKVGMRYLAVRFGNVLGSNGSVVPIFQKQIADGGPVTVTHPDARRYFMTIPEAVQLVLQASSMGSASEIFVLEMGAQIHITDLARNLIRLSGLDPDQDISIVYTGLRPGEKLFEELMLDAEGLKPTSHPKIRVLDGGRVSFEQVHLWLDELSAMVEAKNAYGLVQVFRKIVPEYTPSAEMLALCELDRHDVALTYRMEGRHLWQLAMTGISSPVSSVPRPLETEATVSIQQT